VYAVDVRSDRLETLKTIAKDRDLDNIKTILGDYDNPNLPKDELDTVIIMDTYHEMTDYMIILDHVKTALKSGGQIVIIEKLKSRIIGKSRDKQTDAHSLSSKYVKQELEKAGFTIRYENNDLGNWENDPDKVIWMLVAKKDD
jgi:predicted methyltransferase